MTSPVEAWPERGDPGSQLAQAPIRVVLVAGNYLPQTGGLEVYVDRLSDGLTRLCEVGLVTEPWHSAPRNGAIAHYRVEHLVHPRTGEAFHEAARRIGAAIEHFRPSVVHFSNAGTAVYRGVVPTGVATVATVHGNDLTAPWQTTPGRDVTTAIIEGLNACDRVISVSEHTAGLARRWGARAPTTVLISGCDLDRFRPRPDAGPRVRARLGIPPGVPILLTVSRLAPRKGHGNVLAAIAALPARVHWLVVGQGPTRSTLERAVIAAGMTDRVTLLGRVSDEDLPELYGACDVFVLTSEERHHGGFLDSEGFGLVLHEAGACARPVIASDTSGCREAVVHGGTGILVPPGDPQALAGAMAHLLSHPRQAAALGRAAHALLHASGAWPRTARQTLEVYRDALIGAPVEEPPDARGPEVSR